MGFDDWRQQEQSHTEEFSCEERRDLQAQKGTAAVVLNVGAWSIYISYRVGTRRKRNVKSGSGSRSQRKDKKDQKISQIKRSEEGFTFALVS